MSATPKGIIDHNCNFSHPRDSNERYSIERDSNESDSYERDRLYVC